MLSLGLMGACISITNVGMNTCVTAIEQQENRRIMSTSHGMFSGGGMVGAALASFMMGLKVPILLHIGTIALGILGLVLIVRPSIMLIPEEFSSNKQQAKFAWPNRVLVGMIVVSICTNVTEAPCLTGRLFTYAR
ncbi:MAG: hypothetical protein R2822_13535 [Spirosomataceae bacterium]